MSLRIVLMFLLSATTFTLALEYLLRPSRAEENPLEIPKESQPNPEAAQHEFVFWTKEKSEPAPYIVGLRADFQAEGKLSSIDVADQRQAIRQTQISLLNQLDGMAVTGVKQFETIPFLALTVDSAALEKLKSLPDVVSIEEDVPVPAALGDSVPLVNAPRCIRRGSLVWARQWPF